MVQFFKNANYNILGYCKIAIIVSISFIVIGVISIVLHKGLNFSVDFAGGTLVQMKFEKPVKDDLGQIRSAISELGYGTPEVKTIGPVSNNELQIMVKKDEKGTAHSGEIKNALLNGYSQNPFEVQNVETVGPKIGGEMRIDVLIATILALIAILIYVGFRFTLPFGVAAIIPLFHDVLITITIFSFMGLEISLPFFAAVLMIVGYSLNDTIVIFDRIRENLKSGIRGKNFNDIVNGSINQTLSRTIITSVTTFFVVLSLYILGSEAIKDFAFALLIGVIGGTYSTIYIASSILVWWHKKWPIAR